MPKKFKGENSKAVEAKARKAAAKAEESAAKQKAVEDASWEDNDKHVQRKQQRKDDKEKKRHEQLERKKEKEALLAEEMASMKSSKPQPSAKVTRAEIETNKQRLAADAAAQKDKPQPKKKAAGSDDDEGEIEENFNRLTVEGAEARTVDDAITVLGAKGEPEVDMHPEKRMKAAYRAYEDRRLPILKSENPNMRLSQLKQILKKDWMKSEENPMIQFQMAKLNKS